MFAEPDYRGVSPEDHMRVSQAITAAEEKTSGEIFAVVAHASDDYFYVAGFIAAFWIFVLSLAVALADWYFAWGYSLFTLALGQAISLGLILIIFDRFPHLRMVFVPDAIAHRRASGNALRQFLAHGIQGTQHRSGVLLFVSLAERYAEVVADREINEKVEQKDWDQIAAMLVKSAARGRLADGFLQAIEASGVLLAQHFPPESKDHNELGDRLVEI